MDRFDKLLDAFENDKTNNIMKTSRSEIKEAKNDILQQLGLPRETLKDYHQRLKDYIYVDNIDGLESGHYIRWINLSDGLDLNLNKGGYLCDIDIGEHDIYLVMKPIYNRHFRLKMSNVIIFKRLTPEEQLILSAMKYVQKKS